MGVNGAGKSTLLKLVAGSTEPDDGKRDARRQREDGLLRAARDGAARRRAHRARGAGARVPAGRPGLAARARRRFGFSGDDVEKRCRVLSGGEKARLVLAKMLYDPPNFLVLDEPTNHLDIATKEMLIAALSQLRGHDAVRLARPAVPRRALEPRARADPRGHPPVRRRLHRVRRATGHEAPGMRS